NSLFEPEQLFIAINSKLEKKDYMESLIYSTKVDDNEWVFSNDKQDQIFSRLKAQKKVIGDVTRKIFVGLQTSADNIFVLKVTEIRENSYICYSKSLKKEVEIEKGLVKPFLMGKEVHRYDSLNPENIVIFPYFITKNIPELMPQKFLKEHFPNGWEYILSNKQALSNREKGIYQGSSFYAFGRPQNLNEFECSKIVTPDIAHGCQLTYDDKGVIYHTTTIYSFVFNDDIKEKDLYFLGILNSKLFWFFLSTTGNVLRGGYFRFKTEYIKPFPIRLINFSDPADVARHDRMVALVESMLNLHKQSAAARLPDEKDRLARQIEQTDRQIDKLVYELYGLSEEEIKIVEGG
ncbi:MAG: TaqI-like C-terminal specificity domain-containing protein, partial [Anaerolineaceae bacterium]|nr:TaqI-like C-terminal specificity domain-containing protein [Anaerolineaceae bacterium]